LLGFSVEDVRRELNNNVSKSQLYKMRLRLESFGCVRPPPVCKLGRPMVFQKDMREAVVEFLMEYDKLATIDEVQAMIEEEFGIFPSWETVRTEVHRAGLTKKVIERAALQRDDTCRNRYLSDICHYRADQMCFIDESAANERTAERRRGWSPRGWPCRVIRSSRRSKRWSICPVITVDGYLAWEIYQDSFTEERFNAFIEDTVLPLMNPYSKEAKNCVLIMDNHSIHHSDALDEMCARKGIHLVYLAPYSPDFNPIEQSFAQLKAWMRKNQRLADTFGRDFEGFIVHALRHVFDGKDARGHYRACGYGTAGPEPDSDDEE